ncbi:MAG TPA: oligosaccharide flippase family protein [Pyrinomonadaceae bacterium]|nr:oligosaccharide flippase family protein [Pyrinomonadaceae bacterium]
MRRRLLTDRTSAGDGPLWLRFRRNLSIGLLGSVLSVAVRLAQTALLAKALSIDDFGRVLIVTNLFVFLEAFVGLRVSDLVFRLFQPLEERGDARALQGLLLLSLALSLATGLVVGVGVFALSPWISGRFYGGVELAPLFKIYACAAVPSALREVYEPVLRIRDRFTSVVVPQVLGGLATFAILAAYLLKTDPYDLRVVVAAFAVGVFVQTLPPLASALRLMRASLVGIEVGAAARSLGKYRRELWGTLFHSNVSGYLKFAVNPGDVFLLGLFSGPAQVALYGLARQLTAPLALLQTNAQTAVAPEVMSLVAARRFAQLRRLVGRYVTAAAAVGVFAVACGLTLGGFVINLLSRPEYAPALPVFYVLLIASSLMLAAVVFRPASVGLDLMRWYNAGLLLSACVVFAFVLAGGLDARRMAYAQLFGALIVRVACNVPVWARLRALAPRSGKTTREESGEVVTESK